MTAINVSSVANATWQRSGVFGKGMWSSIGSSESRWCLITIGCVTSNRLAA
jgi:hypothetical protein